jgi:hypothetical protein
VLRVQGRRAYLPQVRETGGLVRPSSRLVEDREGNGGK